MANKKKTTGTKTRRPSKAEQVRQAAIRRMFISLGLAVLIIVALLQVGAFGLTLYNLVRWGVGSLAPALLLTIFIYLFTFKWLRDRPGFWPGVTAVLAGLLVIWQAYFAGGLPQEVDVLSGHLSILTSELLGLQVTQFVGGGLLGLLLYIPIAFLFSNIGSYFIGILLLALGSLLVSQLSVYDVGDWLLNTYHQLTEAGESLYLGERQRRLEAKIKKEEEQQDLARTYEKEQLPEAPLPAVDLETGEILDGSTMLEETPIFLEEVETAEEEEVEGTFQEFSQTSPLGPYVLPSIQLFPKEKSKSQSREQQQVRENVRILESTFASFSIDAKVERAEIGPSVTKYEIKPAVGVRVNRISNLADDLALALAAKDVRIEAPIPGKSLVGIEVPNSEVATVGFRELWEQAQLDSGKLLELPLGKAVNGQVRTFDLAKMPHLLVAGSTGSGKSVAVNGIIASILMKARPDQVKFLMIDPKMVELSVYNDIPHLLIPVVTNPRKASRALQKVVDEMEERYQRFSKVGARNIQGYNERVAAHNAESDVKEVPLPLIVVIVDELADLMMVASKEVEDAIIRLGQKARAAGIHMILATQRPSVDVISGLIKANVPSRVAFAVSSGTDSRTILDENGAEKLLGRGDMLFKPIDENHPVRLQGSFISDQAVETLVNFIKDQAEVDYDETFDPGDINEAEDFGSSGSSQGDPLFAQARSLVVETQKASASMIQRRLSVGFNRATRLMEELEQAGVIGPAEGTKPRKVLVTQIEEE
ncbi:MULTISPECIES: DNA translocase FtsK [unclassified Streptococcus]|uniref:DNA translocase FtsK n=1 Tax=unclassified Streptococcus TaxID=2608887 RepID=UPI001072619C|nr:MULTISPECIES: DNA translocase FtsK [unclassified Streptococcus]MBF0806213.1 DNA translocase FtsK [Streptococcus sp. 19428wA2_WM07]TFU28196.1 DNA translocase FtsK [Streptococcus sp. WM07]